MELTDEQLTNVTGGKGSGNIPAGGITYNTYTTAYGGRYYAKNVGDTDLLRTEISGGAAFYYQETLNIDTVKNTWSSTTVRQLPGQPQNFYSVYPYVLNIKP